MTIILYIILATSPLMRLMRIRPFAGLPVISLERVIFIILIFMVFLRSRSRSEKQLISFTPLVMAFMIYFIYCFMNGMINDITDVKEMAQLLVDTYLMPIVLTFIIYNYDSIEKMDINKLVIAFVVSGVISGLIAYAEFLAGRNLIGPEPVAYSYASSIFRPNGPYYDVTEFGSVQLVYLPLLFLTISFNIIGKYRGCFLIIFIALSSVITMSRAVIIVLLLIIILMYSLASFKNSLLSIAMVVTLAIIYSIYSSSIQQSAIYADRMDPKTITGRYAMYWQEIYLFMKHPVIGIGYNKYIESHILGTHNSFLLVLIELGILGMGLFLFLIGAFLRPLVKSLKCANGKEGFRASLSLLLIVIIVPNTIELLNGAQFMPALAVSCALIDLLFRKNKYLDDLQQINE